MDMSPFTPREAVLLSLASMYDHAAEEESVLVALGEYDRAEAEHQRARILLRAWQAEQDNPVPVGLITA